MSKKYESKSASIWRSYDFVEQLGTGDPYRLLCSAIVFQCAADCEAVKRYGEGSFLLQKYAKGAFQEMSVTNILDFINSEWLEFLLSWQDNISIEAVKENLKRRLGVENL